MKTEETTAITTEAPKARSAAPKKAAGKKAAKPASKKASKTAGARKPTKTKSASAKTARPAEGTDEVRAGTKKAIVLELLRREQGARGEDAKPAKPFSIFRSRECVNDRLVKQHG